MGALDLLHQLGTRVVEVPDLDPTVIYVEDYDIALIRSDLSPAERKWAVDWVLSAALCELTGLEPEPR